MLEEELSEFIGTSNGFILLGKSSLPASEEDNHDRGDDELHRGRECNTQREHPLKDLLSK